jgi:hypothetical protein
MIDKTTDADFIQKQVNKHKPTSNEVLDDPELFDLQASAKANLKEFSFKIFGRTFRFETYTIKEVHKITDCDEIMCSDEAIMNRCVRDNLTPEQHSELIEITGLSYKKDVLGNKVPQAKYEYKNHGKQ